MSVAKSLVKKSICSQSENNDIGCYMNPKNPKKELQYFTEGVSRREVWSWAMFDFANSGYTTVVITAIFNAYFVAVVANNQDWGTFAWTASLAVSYILIILTAPALGAYADIYAY